MPAASITLDEALDLARTGDVWLFRGRAMADRAIQVATNSPVNHVGMSVVIEDLLDPPATRAMEDAVLRTIARLDGTPFPSTTRLASRWLLGRVPAIRHQAAGTDLETAYCAEVLAVTYQAMGLLASTRHTNWYDAGRFWSGDHLGLAAGFRLGGEIAVHIPPREPGPPQPPAPGP